MSVVAEIAKLRTIAEDARRDYATKSEAAKKAAAAAEKVELQLDNAKDSGSTKAKWEDAIQKLQAACEAATAVQVKTKEWMEQSKKKVAGLISEKKMTTAAGGDAERTKKEIEEEVKKATEAFVMGVIDVAKEKQKEVTLLQKVYADALKEKEKNKRDDLDEYMKGIQDSLATKNKEVSTILEAAQKESETTGGGAKGLQDFLKTMRNSSITANVSNVLSGAKNIKAIKKIF